jgi:hypothetical protein
MAEQVCFLCKRPSTIGKTTVGFSKLLFVCKTCLIAGQIQDLRSSSARNELLAQANLTGYPHWRHYWYALDGRGGVRMRLSFPSPLGVATYDHSWRHSDCPLPSGYSVEVVGVEAEWPLTPPFISHDFHGTGPDQNVTRRFATRPVLEIARYRDSKVHLRRNWREDGTDELSIGGVEVSTTDAEIACARRGIAAFREIQKTQDGRGRPKGRRTGYVNGDDWEHDRAKILRLSKQGYTRKQIRAQTGVPESTQREWLKE